MIGDRDDLNRPLGTEDLNRPTGSPADPQYRETVRDDRSMGWGIPALIVAILLIGGILLFGRSDDRTQTAANNPPATQSTTAPGAASTSAPSPAAPNAQSTPSATPGTPREPAKQ